MDISSFLRKRQSEQEALQKVSENLKNPSASQGKPFVQPSPQPAPTHSSSSGPTPTAPLQLSQLQSLEGVIRTDYDWVQQAIAAPPSFEQPNTITDWRRGLRYTVDVLHKREDFASKIQELVKKHDLHMEDMMMMEARVVLRHVEGKKATRDDIQRAFEISRNRRHLGTAAQFEIDSTERAIYNMTRTLVTEQSRALALLGVPFFGTSKNHIRVEAGSSVPAADGKITKKEQLQLRRKMLQFLVDMYV